MRKQPISKIVSNPKILSGKPIIAGTRISVELIMDLLASGLSVEEIIQEYTFLRKQDIQAAISFASSIVKREEIYPILNKNGEYSFPSL